MKNVIVSVTNNLVNDQRVDRVCQSLQRWGYKVILVGRSWPLSPLPERSYSCKRLKLLFNKKFWFYAEYNVRLFFFLLFRKADILIANDLDTLPANYLISKIKPCSLYFDSHEYFSETPEVYQRRFVKSVWLLAERLFIKGCERYYTVSTSLAGIYQQKYGLKFEVIRNVPFRQVNIENVESKEKIILYQGSINIGRGLELMLQALHLIPQVQLIIAGNGPEITNIKLLTESLGLSNRVQFTGNILPDLLRELTKKASVGISIEEAMGESYLVALPNKLFDYIQARVPVLVSDLTEMKSIVEQYNVGMVLDKRTPENLAFMLNIMLNDEVKRKTWKENLGIAAQELCWEKEELILKKIFE